MDTSHNFCPVSGTVIWLPSLSVQEKGTSSFKYSSPLGPRFCRHNSFSLASIVQNAQQYGRTTSVSLRRKEKKCLERNASVSKGSRGLSEQCVSGFLHYNETDVCVCVCAVLSVPKTV